ncbi:MAG: serine/threonine protein kinase [Crocinitomicaceae bacterium]|jgi:serine/threonine protein kinase
MSQDHSQQSIEFIPPSVDHLGELLPAYNFEKLIATGGMGAVYQATQTSLDRPVAVKVLPPELGESESFRESFVKEAKLMARLNHPNLVSVFDCGEIDGLLYIVMELVDGATVYDKTYGGHLEQQEALEVIIAICRGLENAHEAGILHRDIKPANIFITESGAPKIGDFGLARPSGDTETGVIFGTPGYTAPEVLGSPDKVGPATDIYAVGIMLYELLAGKIPGDLYEPVTKYAKCDPMIDRFIRKAIAPKLINRYSSAEEFADDLEEIFRSAKKGPSTSDASPRLLTQTNKQTTKSQLSSTSKYTTLSASSPIKIQPQIVTSALITKTNGQQATLTASAPAKARTNTSRSVKIKDQSPPLKVASASGGSNARNFIIIMVLLGAIYGVLEWKNARERKIARINKENIDKIVIDKPEVTNIPKPQKPPEVDIPVIEKLTTLETLEKLRSSLAAGNLPTSQMPESTISLDNGERLVLFIDKKLTWRQAVLWAADYGAQLATVSSSSDISGLRKAIPSGDNAWIGAATAGYKQWAWADGTPWTDDSIDIRKTSKLAFAQLDSDMFASAKKSGDRAKFLIEWKADSSQPAALNQQMKRVAATLDNPTPLYPPGSFTFGNRSFYLCPYPLTLKQAQKLATSAGAQIATPSDEVEAVYFSELITASVPSGRLCRIGGILDNNKWKWLSGEEWTSATWDENYPKDKDSIVIASSSSKWQDASKNKPVAYTLFEWSKDAPAGGAITPSENGGPSKSGLEELQSKASKIVKNAYEKREEEHIKNVERLTWDLNFYLKGLNRSDKVRHALSVQQINELIAGKDRVEKSIAGVGSSVKIQKLTFATYEKQGRIDLSYDETINKIRLLYQEKLREIIQDLENKSQLTAAKQAMIVLKASSAGTQAFIESFD